MASRYSGSLGDAVHRLSRFCVVFASKSASVTAPTSAGMSMVTARNSHISCRRITLSPSCLRAGGHCPARYVRQFVHECRPCGLTLLLGCTVYHWTLVSYRGVQYAGVWAGQWDQSMHCGGGKG